MKTRQSTRGFTLTEILIAAGIATAILGTLVAAFGPATERARAGALLRRAREHGVFLRDAVNARTLPEPLPMTRAGNGGTVPSSGALAGGSAAKQDQAANFDAVMLAHQLVESIPPLPFGTTRPLWAEAVKWDTTTKTFLFSSDSQYAGAEAAWAAAATVSWPRLESRLSDPSLAPSAAAGANFRLARAVDLGAQRVVIFWRLPNVTAAFALALAKAANPVDYQPASGTALDIGPVAYAAPVNDRTDVYLYIIHF